MVPIITRKRSSMEEAGNAGSQRSLALLPHSETPHQALLAELLKVTNGVSPAETGTLLHHLCKSGWGSAAECPWPFKAFMDGNESLDCCLLFFSFSLRN